MRSRNDQAKGALKEFDATEACIDEDSSQQLSVPARRQGCEAELRRIDGGYNASSGPEQMTGPFEPAPRQRDGDHPVQVHSVEASRGKATVGICTRVVSFPRRTAQRCYPASGIEVTRIEVQRRHDQHARIAASEKVPDEPL